LEELLPIGADLLVHQLLGHRQIGNPGKAIIPPPIENPGPLQLAGEPLPPVKANLHQKRKPRLQPQMQEPQLLVDKIEIQMDTLTPDRGLLNACVKTFNS
jgi:hypothetical protein